MNVLTIIFDRHPNIIFYICYIERVANTHKELLKGFTDFKFKVEEVGQEISKEIDKNSFIYKVIR